LVRKKISHLAKISHFLPPNLFISVTLKKNCQSGKIKIRQKYSVSRKRVGKNLVGKNLVNCPKFSHFFSIRYGVFGHVKFLHKMGVISFSQMNNYTARYKYYCFLSTSPKALS